MADKGQDESYTTAKQFVEYYYSCFDSDRSKLSVLYRPSSMMSWEEKKLKGVDAIISKLTALPFETVKHVVTTLDAMPSSETVASLIVIVTGQLTIDKSEVPLQFCQVFHLVPEGQAYFIFNDCFRLTYV